MTQTEKEKKQKVVLIAKKEIINCLKRIGQGYNPTKAKCEMFENIDKRVNEVLKNDESTI